MIFKLFSVVLNKEGIFGEGYILVVVVLWLEVGEKVLKKPKYEELKFRVVFFQNNGHLITPPYIHMLREKCGTCSSK